MFCGDFRRLNVATKPLTVPLPLFDDILASQGKAFCFRPLTYGWDIGRWHWIKQTRKSRILLAARVYLICGVMPFGLSNAQGVFTNWCQSFWVGLKGLPWRIWTMSWCSTGPERSILSTSRMYLIDYGNKIKLPKCQFLRKETKYLGFVINKNESWHRKGEGHKDPTRTHDGEGGTMINLWGSRAQQWMELITEYYLRRRLLMRYAYLKIRETII